MDEVHSWTNEDEFWRVAARNVPRWRRRLGLSTSKRKLERIGMGSPDWANLQAKMKPGDKAFPFEFNRRTLAMRKGYVVLRNGEPIGGIVTELS